MQTGRQTSRQKVKIQIQTGRHTYQLQINQANKRFNYNLKQTDKYSEFKYKQADLKIHRGRQMFHQKYIFLILPITLKNCQTKIPIRKKNADKQ